MLNKAVGIKKIAVSSCGMSCKPGKSERFNIRRKLKASAEVQGYITSSCNIEILASSSENRQRKTINVPLKVRIHMKKELKAVS